MRSARARAGRPACILGVCLLVMIEAADATEITVQNDSFQSGGTVAVESGFVTNESAAAWLTSPCNGNIVAVQVFWSSIFGGSPQVLGDSITIFNTGTFPVPNAANFTLLEGPVLTDGVLNEFRYLDENQTIPISIPVVSGQVFIVSFRFGEDPDPFNGPSVVADINGCQQGKNSANIVGSGWVNACNLGISGDFVIRAVINCADAQGACCLTSGGCQITSQSACSSQGGSYRGNNTTCQTNTCDGACCFADGTCTQTNQGNCTSGGGTYKGVGVACTAGLCVGACCLPNGSCSDAQSRNLCSAAGGVYKGDGTTCGGSPCTGACCALNGSCQQLTLTQCTGQGGTWNGPATNCGTFTCPVAGACCLSDGSCVNGQTQAQCAGLGGNWDGAATVCGAVGICERACCFGSGCVNLTKSDCTDSAGTWQGVLYHCNGSSCPTGACCLTLGDCVEATTPVSCAAMGGTFKNGMTCAQAACPVPIGACCVYATGGCIANRTPQQCGIIGGTWAGANTACPAACCPGPGGIAADINNDGAVNAKDVQRFTSAMLGTPTTLERCRGDYDQNGSLGVGDIAGFVNALLNGP